MNNENNLTCSVCLDILYLPMEHRPCGNIFCHGCLNDVKKCPMCRQDFTKDDLVPLTVRMILSAISDIHFKCDDCGEKVLRENEKRHRDECQISCKNCHLMIVKIHEQEHLEKVCQGICRQCWKKITNNHDSICEFRKVVCEAKENECDWSGPYCDKGAHELTCKLLKCRRKYEAIIENMRVEYEGVRKSSKLGEIPPHPQSGKSLFSIVCVNSGKFIGYANGSIYPSTDNRDRLWFYLEKKHNGHTNLLEHRKEFRIKAVLNDNREFYLERFQNVATTDNSNRFSLHLFPNPTQYWIITKRHIHDGNLLIVTDNEILLSVKGLKDSSTSRETICSGVLTIFDYEVCTDDTTKHD